MTNTTSDKIAKKPNKRLRTGLMIMYVGLGINLFGFFAILSLVVFVIFLPYFSSNFSTALVSSSLVFG